MFRTIIPLVRYTMSDFADEWFKWLEVDEKWRPKLTESLKNIEIDGKLHKMKWEELITCLVPNWIEVGSKLKALDIAINKEKRLSLIEKVTKLDEEKGTSLDEKGHKLTKMYITENNKNNGFEGISSIEKGYKSMEENRPSLNEKVTKLPNKKLKYLTNILLMSASPISIDELMSIFDYKHKGKFRQNYINRLESVGFIRKTNPEKPTASNQKYLITEDGKRFLTGKE